MNQGDKYDKRALEFSYAGWMKALKDAVGGHPSRLYSGLFEKLPSASDKTYFYTSKGRKTADSWFTRMSLPTRSIEHLDKRLSEVALSILGHTPDGVIQDLTLEQVIKLLRNARAENQPGARASHATAVDLYNSQVLKYPAGKINELNELELLLGSSVVGGELPVYCERELDAKIISALDDPLQKLVVIVGPPKSGKTRSLIQNLKTSTLSKNLFYWLESSNKDAPGALARAITDKRLQDPVVILDDLQRFDFEGPNSINRSTFRQLLGAAKVVATIHSRDVQLWKDSEFDRSTAGRSPLALPPADLKSMVLDSSFEIKSELNPEEAQRAEESFPNVQDKSKLKHLASFLAATEYLTNKAMRIRNGDDPYELAFLETLINAKIVWRSGIELTKLKELFSNVLRAKTNSPWSETKWERVTENFTSGPTPQSPHALLIRSSKNRDLYELYDGVWGALRPDNWAWEYQDAIHLNIDDICDMGLSGYALEAIRLLELEDQESQGLRDFWLGFFHHDAGDYSSAESFYLKAIEAGDTDALNNLGNVLIDQGRPTEAENYYQKAIEAGDTEAFFNLGLSYGYQGRLEEAETYYRKALDAGDTDALLNLGNIYTEQGRFEQAETHYQKALEAGDTDAFFNLGNIYKEQGRFEQAETYYQQSIKAGNNSTLLNLGNLYKEQGRIGDAEAHYQKALEAGDTDALFNLGNLYRDQGLFREAETYYQHSIKAGDVDALLNLGNIYEEQGRLEEAETHFLRAGEAGISNALLNLGNLYLEQGRLEEAETFYLQAIDASISDALLNLGNLYKEQGRLEEAETYYLKAIEAGDAGALNGLGNLYADQDNIEEAETYYLKAIEAGSNLASYNLGLMYEGQGKPEKAEDLYLKAIEVGNSSALFNLGNLYNEQARLEEAETYYLKAIEAGDKDSLNNLGIMLADQDRLEEAETYFLKAIEAGDKDSLNNLGIVLADQGRFEEAETYFLQAIEAGSNSASYNLGLMYHGQGEFEQAEGFYLKAIDEGNTKALLELGNLYNEHGRLEEAEVYFAKAKEARAITN